MGGANVDIERVLSEALRRPAGGQWDAELCQAHQEAENAKADVRRLTHYSTELERKFLEAERNARQFFTDVKDLEDQAEMLEAEKRDLEAERDAAELVATWSQREDGG